jgi:hypothetical protein
LYFFIFQQQQLHQQGLPHIHAPPISLPHGGHPPHLPPGMAGVIELSGISGISGMMPSHNMSLVPGIKDEKGQSHDDTKKLKKNNFIMVWMNIKIFKASRSIELTVQGKYFSICS